MKNIVHNRMPKKSFRSLLFLIFSLVFMTQDLSATHVVGGNLYYRCIGDNLFEITLEFRRDCFNGSPAADFDDPASIGIFDPVTGEQLLSFGENGELLPRFSTEDTLNEILTSECQIIGEDVCVHSTIYRDTVQLSYRQNGFLFAYQRCCRNITLLNIVDPLDSGTTYYTVIEADALTSCNSQATFNEWATIYLCANEEIVFDHSGTDLDGDSLAYKLCVPSLGASDNIPIPTPPDAPPYEDVVWSPGYDLNNLMGGVPFQIDPVTGALSGVPNTIGQFLIGVCIEEWRDGELIATTRRDFEYNVRECLERPDPDFSVEPNPNCESLEQNFINLTASGEITWFFEYPDLSNPIFEENPSYIFPGPGLYTVALAAVDGECRDTAFVEVGVGLPDDTTVDFDLMGNNCTDQQVDIQFNDLSTSLQEIVAWNWTIDHDQTTTVFMEQNPLMTFNNDQQITVNLEVTTISGCTHSISEQIDLNSIDLNLLPNPAMICLGNSTPLVISVSEGVNLEWSPTDFLDLTDPLNPIASPEQTTTYQVTASNGLCTIMDEVTVEVSSEQDIFFVGDTSICNGLATIEAMANVGASFEWFSDAALTMSLGTDNPLTYTLNESITTLYVSLINDVCDGTNSITLYDHSLDTNLSVQNGGNSCDGDEITVTLENNNPGQSLTILWSEDGLVSGQGTDNATYSFSDAGDYEVSYSVENEFGCTDNGSTTITVNEYPLLNLTSPQVLCEGGSVELNPGANENWNYSWTPTDPNIISDPNIGNPSVFNITESTTFTVVVSNNEDGLCSVSDEVVVMPAEPINLNLDDEYIYCQGDTAIITADADVEVTYVWTNSNNEVVYEGNPLVVIDLPPGIYTVTAEDEFGCTQDAQIDVSYSPDLNLEISVEDMFYCEGSDVELTASTSTNSSIIWFDENGVEIGQGNEIIVTPEGDVSYTVTAIDDIGCMDTNSISLSPYIQNLTIDSPTVLCLNEEGVATVSLSDNNMNVTYLWEPQGPIVNGQGTNEISFVLSETTTFIVTVMNDADCVWTESFTTNLSVFNDPVVATATPSTVNLGEEVQLETVQDDSYSYEWSPSETLDFDDIYNPIATPVDENTTYSVIVTNADGCTESASVAVAVVLPVCDENDVFVPNMFTPNGDGLNDTWRIESNFIDEMELIVYSRWGEEVFKSNSQNVEWDGTFENEQLEPDVYGYWLNVVCINGFEYVTQGNVTILK